MNKNIIIKTIAWMFPVALMVAYSCEDSFLEQPQKGALGDELVITKKGAEQSLIGAYAALKGNQGNYNGSNTGWVFGSIVGGDAHKGSDAGDQSDINSIANFTATSTNSYFNAKWITNYDGINRANSTIKILDKLEPSDISDADKTTLRAEARFLRGFFHFEVKKMWNMVPYVDEKIDYLLGNFKVPNDRDIWADIEADFKFGYDNLAGSGMAAGRANKWAAGAFLAKAYVFQGKWQEAKAVLDAIIAEGTTPGGARYGLMDRFHDNFEMKNDNTKESVFAYQASINDGSGGNNSNFDEILNWPYNNGPGGCCGFFQPSFELANSYRTDGAGLPLLDRSYNSSGEQLRDDMGIAVDDPGFTPDAGNLDPRIDWTIGRRGIPYLDWGTHPGASWVRLQSNGGPYSPKKHAYAKADESSVTDGSSWTKGLTGINVQFIRYAQVLLWAAEAEAELVKAGTGGSLEKAREYVNMIRSRAANPAGFVKASVQDGKTDWDAYLDATVASQPAAKYVVAEYPSFPDATYALRAIHFEHKLEFGMEGHRFFDLVRWDETTSAGGNPVNLQAYLDYEGTRLGIYKGVTFVRGKHDYYPLPQNQIDLEQTGGVSALNQNPGY
jgi:starch-binding outer membrane protein, SusD/RagB family